MGGTADKKVFVIVVAALFLVIVAILLDLQYLYLMAAALAVLPFASYLLAFRLRAPFRVVRDHPTMAQEGRLTPVTLTITAEGGLPQASLRVTDAAPAELPVRGEGGGEGPQTLDSWDGQIGERRYQVEPTKRGVYRLGPTRIHTTDPLGLFAFPVTLPDTTEMVVHPTPIPARNTTFGGEGIYGVRERDGKTRRGDGMDFHGVREYRHGDALRRVHWPTTARTGQLAVIEFERAFERDLIIGLDVTQGTDYGQGRESTLEYAVKVAATLTDRTLAAGGGVTLVTQPGSVSVRPREGDPAAARFQLFDRLARLRADAEQSLADMLQASRPPAGSQFAILTAGGDPHLTAFLSERIQHGDSVWVIFFEPGSFGGPRVMSPAVAGGRLTVVEREHSPWREGGKSLEYLLRDSAG